MKTLTATVKAKDASPSTPVQLKNQEVVDRLNDRIARRAYEMFELGGSTDGEHLRHWLEAEAESVRRIPEISESSSWYTVRVPLQDFAKENVSVAVEPSRAIILAEKVSSSAGSESLNSASFQDSFFLVANWPSEVDPVTASAYIKNDTLTLTAKRSAPVAE
jgi:HSP20 family molecular chaperone IbpA